MGRHSREDSKNRRQGKESRSGAAKEFIGEKTVVNGNQLWLGLGSSANEPRSIPVHSLPPRLENAACPKLRSSGTWPLQ